jgi:hypothetical protein
LIRIKEGALLKAPAGNCSSIRISSSPVYYSRN